MGLGREIDDPVHFIVDHRPAEGLGIADVGAHELKLPDIDQLLQARRIAGIGEEVIAHQAITRMPTRPVMAEIGADEAGGARYQHGAGHDARSLTWRSSVARRPSRQCGDSMPSAFSVTRLSSTL